MNKGIIVAGNLTTDYVKTIDVYPEKGMLSEIRSISKCVGGCAANTAINLAVIDPSIPVKSIGTVGDDENGRFISDVLRNRGVDISLIVTHSEVQTSLQM